MQMKPVGRSQSLLGFCRATRAFDEFCLEPWVGKVQCSMTCTSVHAAVHKARRPAGTPKRMRSPELYIHGQMFRCMFRNDGTEASQMSLSLQQFPRSSWI
jgi:hypothetical protein